jgi:hypothetical protein
VLVTRARFRDAPQLARSRHGTAVRAATTLQLVQERHGTALRARLCAAIVDRLTFGGNIIETGTDSYRLAATRAAQRA